MSSLELVHGFFMSRKPTWDFNLVWSLLLPPAQDQCRDKSIMCNSVWVNSVQSSRYLLFEQLVNYKVITRPRPPYVSLRSLSSIATSKARHPGRDPSALSQSYLIDARSKQILYMSLSIHLFRDDWG